MAHIEILRSVMISGEPAAAGSIVETSEQEAQYLIGMGLAATAAAPAPEPKPEPEPEVKPTRTRKHAPDPED
jgi:hypothetical protein